MKKLFLFLGISIFSFCSFSIATTIEDAVAWAYTQKLTIHYSTEDFWSSKLIRRDEAAKFFVKFAKLLWKTSYIVNANQCIFFDKNQARDDLQDTIVEACRLGLFKGNNGKFNPTGNITNAEVIAVLVRLVDGYQPENGSHWAENYYTRATALWLLNNVTMTNKDTPTQRGNIIISLYDARNLKSSIEKNNQHNEMNIRNIGDGVINLSNDKERWFLEQVYTTPDGINKVEIDFIQIKPCSWSEICRHFEYVLINDNNKLRTFSIEDDTNIFVVKYDHDTPPYIYSANFSDLLSYRKNNRSNILMLFSLQNWNLIQMEQSKENISITFQQNNEDRSCGVYNGIFDCVT